MKAISLTLLYLGSVLFFGVDATKLDIASNFKRKWTTKLLSRVRRDLPARVAAESLHWNLPKQVADPRVHSFIRTQDVKDILQKPSLESRRIRVKREPACKLSICVTQDLVKRLNQWTDSSKDLSAPPKKLTISGYGRRRRSFAFLVQG
ncbi:pro-adrenomedullin [Pituophis catenifer annectens]|uniref:pro-adrenomedullin n=1 Tax=Pituophis catenifer annectens TaxID=94852 RepID=UPI003995EDF1